MTLFESGDPRPIHFMGIAGAGMSGLALLARHQGAAVTGCDKDPQGAADLAVLGVEIWRGHDPGHVSGARAVVVTAAVPREHPELEQAGALGIPVVRRADALGQAVASGAVVGVAGTHGKTTTTAMVTEALAAAGRNPTGLAGGRVAPWGGNARLGGRELFVVEADEFDRAFLSLAPTVAVVNNVEAAHLECYGTVQALEDAFVQFAGRARRVIAGADDAGAERVAARVSGPVWRVGLARDADVRIADPELDDAGSRARGGLPDGRELRLALGGPGLHNLRDAGAALAVACELGGGGRGGGSAGVWCPGTADPRRDGGPRGARRGPGGGDDGGSAGARGADRARGAHGAGGRRRLYAGGGGHHRSGARTPASVGAGSKRGRGREGALRHGRRAKIVLLAVGGAAALAAWLGAPALLSRVAYFRVRQGRAPGGQKPPPPGRVAGLRAPPRA